MTFESYVSPEAEVIELTMGSPVMDGSQVVGGGTDDGDLEL